MAGCAAAVRGTIARPKPEARGLAEAPFEAADGPQLAEQTDLADGDRRRPDGPVAQRRREGEREREVEARLVAR